MQHSFHFLLVRRSRELCVVVLAIALAGIAGCRVTDLQIWRPVEPVTPDSLPVKEIRDISYRDEAKTVPFRHKLDLFLPKDKKDFPVVVLVHGGAWIIGDNRCCGLYSSVGHFLASQGIGAVLPNYRLSPGVKHPNHVQDVAKVLAWTRATSASTAAIPIGLFCSDTPPADISFRSWPPMKPISKPRG